VAAREFEILGRLLPDGDRAGYNTAVRVPRDRTLLPFSADGNPPFDGIVVYDDLDPASFDTFELPFPVDDIAVLQDGRVAALDGDRVVLLSLETSGEVLVTDELALPAEAHWLVAQ
jgi:hypothetical protein